MMDHQRFDDLSRLLASGVSRRRILKAVTMTTVAGLFGLGGRSGAGAGENCRSLGATCGTDRQCCSTFCDTGQRPGRCACPPGTTPCGGHAGSPITCVPVCQDGQVLHPYVCQCCTPTESGCAFV